MIQGFWSRFFPAYSDLNNLLEANSIGDVKHIQATFGFDAYRDGTAPERLINKDLGGKSFYCCAQETLVTRISFIRFFVFVGGVLLDLGCYLIQFAQFVFKEDPISITSSATKFQEGEMAGGACDCSKRD